MSVSTILIGYVTDIFPAEQITPQFKKRILWLKEPDTEKYPEHWQVECTQDACSLLDKVKHGDFIRAHVNVRGKKYSKGGKDSIFNTLVCWKIDKQEMNGSTKQSVSQPARYPQNDNYLPLDDAPF